MKFSIHIKIVAFLVTLFFLTSFQQDTALLTCERIEYLISTKQSVANKFWKDFNRKTLFGSMLYYTSDGLYTINANKQLNERLDINKIDCKSTNYSLGYVAKIVDTTQLYMYVSYEDEDSTVLEYKNILAMFSDVELTQKFIPDVKDTEEWMSMVIHETFHQYQKDFKKFRMFQVESQSKFDRDTLIYFYQNLDWFKQSLITENQILLNTIQEQDKRKIKANLTRYLNLKKNRIKQIKDEFGIDIFDLESSLSRSEGTARYIEYCVKSFLKTQKENRDLSKLDSKYIQNRFKNYVIEQDKWMYDINKNYFYSVGFNITRIFEKLNIDYQNDIFLENHSFDYYLENYI